MPPDNSATVAPGAPVAFPRDGPTSGSIYAANPTTFVLPDIGTYEVSFSVPVNGAGQLVLVVNGTQLAYTVYGRATGTTEIAGDALVQTSTPGSDLEVENPAGEVTALTITTDAGGTDADVASLVIKELG
jgi:hypothetical protein